MKILYNRCTTVVFWITISHSVYTICYLCLPHAPGLDFMYIHFRLSDFSQCTIRQNDCLHKWMGLKMLSKRNKNIRGEIVMIIWAAITHNFLLLRCALRAGISNVWLLGRLFLNGGTIRMDWWSGEESAEAVREVVGLGCSANILHVI